MNEILKKPYSPKDTEERIYQKWETSGFFNPDNLPGGRKETFTIVMPPPNANGRLHAGHALFITLEDIMTRYKRMSGFKTLWIPGADHAGFETQVVYEKHLEKEGRSRFNMEPQDLYKEILDFTLKNKKEMESDVRRLGASCDWSREKFTLDADVVRETQKTFAKMFDDGLVYRGSRIINWCTKHQTSLSEVETEFTEKTDPFYYIKYGPFTIATARPETKFGDKYVVVHPDDKRYADYTDGQEIKVDWLNGKITATVIKDDSIDMEFGTGAMTITPWHDAIDFGIAERHGLDKEQIIDWQGKLLPIAGEFAGMKIKEARPKIVAKLHEMGLLVKTEENYKHNVKVCYKCENPIEPQVKDQWFVKMAPLAKLAVEAVEAEKIKFIPDNSRKIFLYWMNNPVDWNISRQIIWGIPIPAKICDACHQGWPDMEDKMSECPECNGVLRKETDTFDTWFSSGQWPYLVLGYPDNKDFQEFYPTDVMETGHDLIFKWVPRMVIFGLYRAGSVPFHTVYMHGLVNDAQGRKMSKSKGNVINPIDITDKFGTDALRMSLIVGNTPGTDLSLAEDKVKGYKNFANKIWNATRFVMENLPENGSNIEFSEEEQKFLDEFELIKKDITLDMENYRFYLAAEKIYHYFWHTFADIIIEQSKKKPYSASNKKMLSYLLREQIKILHPFMPFITEEIWTLLGNENMLIVEKWPA